MRRRGVPMGGSALRQLVVAVACAAGGSSASSLYLAKLCRNFACHQAERPMMDYDEDKGQCVCREHPCWDDNGQMHHCHDPQFPYLGFHFTEDHKLTCTCSSIPHYGSEHIARDKCAGHRCDQPGHPILDFDEEQEECLCRSHPCWNDKGEIHDCKQPNFPILRYREEQDGDDEVRPVCDCFMKMAKDSAPGQMPLTTAPPIRYDDEEEYMAPEYYDEDEF